MTTNGWITNVSWTSHAYHVAKDFQVLGAASLTFAAAGVAFYGSRWVAQRQAKTTIDALEFQSAEQRRKEEAKQAQTQAAFRIALKQACYRLEIDFRDLARSTRGVIEFSEEIAPELLKVDQSSVLWTRFKRHGPYTNSQPIFSLPFSDVAQADQRSQVLMLRLIDRCNLVDKAILDVGANLTAHSAVIKTYFEAVEDFATKGADMVATFKREIETTRIAEPNKLPETGERGP